MDSPDATADRLARIVAATGLVPATTPEPILSFSNETWAFTDAGQGDVVLRICWIGDPDRLVREGRLGSALPVEVGYPTVLGVGRVGDLTWTLTRKLDGSTLLEAWPELPPDAREAACRAVADRVRALQEWRPPAGLADLLVPRALSATADANEVIGRSISPLPDGIAALVENLGSTAPPEVGQAVDLIARGRGLLPRYDDPGLGLTHGDLHLGNVWWDGHAVSGLMDLEWARYAPAWVDLARLKDNADVDALEGGLGAHLTLLSALRHDHPAMFAVDRLDERVRLLQLAHQLRMLVVWGIPSPGAALPVDHPLLLIRGLLAEQD